MLALQTGLSFNFNIVFTGLEEASPIMAHNYSTKHRLGDDIKDGVEPSFSSSRENADSSEAVDALLEHAVALGLLSTIGFSTVLDTASCADTPSGGENPDHRVHDPGDDGDRKSALEKSLGISGIGAGAAAHTILVLKHAQEVEDGDESKHGEAKERPALATLDKLTNEAGHDHEDVHDDNEDFGELRSVAESGNVPKHERGGDGPVNVASIVEVTAIALRDEAVTRGHGEVGEGGNHADNTSEDTRGGHVVVDAVAGSIAEGTIANSLKASAEEVEGRDEKQGKGNPQNDGAVHAEVRGVDGSRGAAAGDFWCRSSVGRGSIGFLLTVALLLELAVARLLGSTVGLGSVADGSDRCGTAGLGNAPAIAHAWSLYRAALEALHCSLHKHRSGLAVGLLGSIRLLLLAVALLVGALGRGVSTLGVGTESKSKEQRGDLHQ